MRLRYVEQFRALAIVMIVAGHAWYMQDWDRGSLAARLSLTVATNGTYLFVFIAGFLFQHLLPKFETWRYYRSKLRNVVLPYLIVSIPGLIWQFSKEPSGFAPAGFADWPMPFQVLWYLATGVHVGPLWFIPMICLIYVVAPLLARGDRDGRMYYALPLLFIGSLFLHRSPGNADPIHSFLFYLPAYMLGMWTSRNIDAVQAFMARWHWVALAAWVGLVAFATAYLPSPGHTVASAPVYSGEFALPPEIISWIQLQKAVLTYLLLFYLARFESAIGRRLTLLAEASFGIYFLHAYVQEVTAWAAREAGIPLPGNTLMLIALTIGICAATYAVVRAAQLTLGPRSRLVVGS